MFKGILLGIQLQKPSNHHQPNVFLLSTQLGLLGAASLFFPFLHIRSSAYL